MESNSTLIVDTSFLYGLFYEKDPSHQRAKTAARKFDHKTWVTSCFVLHEIFWLLNARHPHLLVKMFEAEQKEIFKVENFERGQLIEIKEIIQKYSNRKIDLADASLIDLAQRLNHGDILTLDERDFTIYRWNRINSFNILL